MEFIVKRDILKGSNTLFPRGTVCKVFWDDKDLPDICVVSADGKSIDMDTVRLPRYFEGIEKPTDDELEDWLMDTTCNSVFGNEVRHDGWDRDGSPSWLAAMELV